MMPPSKDLWERARRNPNYYFGPPVASNTYSGGSITIPMTSTALTPLIGSVPGLAGEIDSEFGVFVLLRTVQGGPTSPPSESPDAVKEQSG